MPTPFTPRLLNDRYALKGESREGGMAKVFPAADLKGDHETVAIKMIGGPDHKLASKVFDAEYRSLESVEHPNVVRVLDWGRDTETNKRFLVFEWIDQDLEAALGEGKTPQGWDDFVEQIGRPLFSALAAAHASSIAHRDIKPANILLTSAGVPKLADFGIAKILTDIAPGFTVADFRTEPFAAPVEEGPHRHVSGDVYSLGVTALAVLSRLDYKDPRYQDSPRLFVKEALQAIDAPAEAIAFLERCTAAKSGDRPPTGGVAESELEMLTMRRDEQAKRLGFDKVPHCYLNLSSKAQQSLVDEFRLSSTEEAKNLLIEDLEQKAWLLPVWEGDKPSDGHFFLLGGELRCHLELMSNEPRFRIHSVRAESDFYLNRDRPRAWSGILDFSLDPPADPAAAQAELSALLDRVLGVDAAQRREVQGSGDSHVLGVWRRSLQALSEVERGR
ncbi:MAG TPA: protein kinase, partial [Solirubrobacterales bacterium]